MKGVGGGRKGRKERARSRESEKGGRERGETAQRKRRQVFFFFFKKKICIGVRGGWWGGNATKRGEKVEERRETEKNSLVSRPV